MADRNRALHRAIAFEHRTPKSDSLGADCKPSYRRAQVDSGPNPAIACPQRRPDGVPKWAVVLRQHRSGGLDQRMVGVR